MVSLLTAWSSQVMCGTKHGCCHFVHCKHVKQLLLQHNHPGSSTPAPGWGQGSQADPQGRATMSQAEDKKQGPGLACNAPQQWSLLLVRWDVCCRWGVWWPSCYGERENTLGNAGCGVEVAPELKSSFTWNRMMQVLLMNQKTILFS